MVKILTLNISATWFCPQILALLSFSFVLGALSSCTLMTLLSAHLSWWWRSTVSAYVVSRGPMLLFLLRCWMIRHERCSSSSSYLCCDAACLWSVCLIPTPNLSFSLLRLLHIAGEQDAHSFLHFPQVQVCPQFVVLRVRIRHYLVLTPMLLRLFKPENHISPCSNRATSCLFIYLTNVARKTAK